MASEQVGNIVYQVQMDVANLLKAQRKVNERLEKMNGGAAKASKSFDQLSTSINKVASAVAASIVADWAKAFLVAADNMSQLNARIERLTGNAQAASQTMQSLVKISSDTGVSLSDTAKLWESLSTALKDTGATNGQVLQLTDTLQKIGKIGGSSSQEISNALRQFGQSISSGTVRAEEFNSILEQTPELARQIATGLGVSIGELRQRMLEGKLTAQDALNAIQKQAASVDAEFAKLPRTLDQANTAFTNSLLTLVDSVNKASGASNGLVAVIDSLAGALDHLQGKSASAASQISDLTSTAEMFERRARTWSWLGLDGWEAQNKALAGLSNRAALLVGDLDKVRNASSLAANTKPIEIKTTAAAKKKGSGGKSQAQKDAESLAKAQGSVNQKLEELRQKADLAANSTGELSRAQSVLNAQQSLGKSATQEQIRLAGEYAGKAWDTANALREQAKAEQANKAAQQLISQSKSTAYNGGLAEDAYAAINLEEQQKLAIYEQFYNQGLLSQQVFEDTKTAIIKDAAQQRLAAQQQEMDAISSGWSSLADSASQFSDSLAGAFASASGESSAAYKTLFAISKGFAIAQATIGMYTAASQALMLPFPANLAAAAKALTFGSQIVGAVSGVNYGGGRKNGGPVAAGSMYQVGESGLPEIYRASTGKQYMIPGDNGRVISNKDLGGGGQMKVNVIINDYSTGSHGYDTQTMQNGDTLTVTAFITDMDNKGPMFQSVTRNTSATPRVR